MSGSKLLQKNYLTFLVTSRQTGTMCKNSKNNIGVDETGIDKMGINHFFTVSLQPGERAILSATPSLPHVVLTTNSLDCVVTDPSMDQEQFVSEVNNTWFRRFILAPPPIV